MRFTAAERRAASRRRQKRILSRPQLTCEQVKRGKIEGQWKLNIMAKKDCFVIPHALACQRRTDESGLRQFPRRHGLKPPLPQSVRPRPSYTAGSQRVARCPRGRVDRKEIQIMRTGKRHNEELELTEATTASRRPAALSVTWVTGNPTELLFASEE